MTDVNEFYTIEKQIQSLYVVKKSKFITNVFPVETQELAEKYIEKIRKKYWDATHNVFAYSIGLKDEIQKFSDDGEPSGTAGKPVLEIIKMNGLKNVLVIVTRYFGGVLLGAGGLIRAYGESADLALKEAGIVKKVLCTEYMVNIDYSLLGKIQWELRQKNLTIKKTDFNQYVSMRVLVPVFMNINFKLFILNITSGNAKVERLGECYSTQ